MTFRLHRHTGKWYRASVTGTLVHEQDQCHRHTGSWYTANRHAGSWYTASVTGTVTHDTGPVSQAHWHMIRGQCHRHTDTWYGASVTSTLTHDTGPVSQAHWRMIRGQCHKHTDTWYGAGQLSQTVPNTAPFYCGRDDWTFASRASTSAIWYILLPVSTRCSTVLSKTGTSLPETATWWMRPEALSASDDNAIPLVHNRDRSTIASPRIGTILEYARFVD